MYTKGGGEGGIDLSRARRGWQMRLYMGAPVIMPRVLLRRTTASVVVVGAFALPLCEASSPLLDTAAAGGGTCAGAKKGKCWVQWDTHTHIYRLLLFLIN